MQNVVHPLLSALGYLHSLGLSHHDVALENVLVTETGRVVLSDFQMVKPMPPPKEMEQTIEPGWKKILTGVSYDNLMVASKSKEGEEPDPTDHNRTMRSSFGWAGDVWGLGILTWELVSASE